MGAQYSIIIPFLLRSFGSNYKIVFHPLYQNRQACHQSDDETTYGFTRNQADNAALRFLLNNIATEIIARHIHFLSSAHWVLSLWNCRSGDEDEMLVHISSPHCRLPLYFEISLLCKIVFVH